MLKSILLFLCVGSTSLFLTPSPLAAQEYGNYYNWCQKGGIKPSTSGQTSTTNVQGSFPYCTVTIYVAGTGGSTLATIYSDSMGTGKDNPFTANSDGSFSFFTGVLQFDVKTSGGGIPSPITISNQSVINPTSTIPVITPQMYGAIGNGTTNDTTAIRLSVLALCNKGGGILYLPYNTFIVRPTVAANPIIPICSNLTVMGVGTIKIGNSGGNYREIFGPSSGAVSNVLFTGFTINQNSSNNPFTLSPFQPRIAIYTGPGQAGGNGANNTISNMHITDILGEWTIFVSSINSHIINNVLDNVGGGLVDTDTSQIYVESGASGTTVTGNRVVATAINSNMAHSGIEVHDTVVVTNNNVENFQTGIQIVGASYSTVSGMLVNNNIIKGAFSCMVLWSSSGLGATNYGLTDTLVDGNTCIVNQLSYISLGGATSGIILQPNADLPFLNIKITNNQVVFDLSDNVTNPYSDASWGIGYWDSTDTNTCQTCDFSHNTVVNAPHAAFRFSAGGRNISFNGIIAINPGSTLNPSASTSFKAGLVVTNVPSITGTLTANDAIVIDNLATSRMSYGMLFISGSSPNPIVSSNSSISCVDTTCASLLASVFSSPNDNILVKSLTVNAPIATQFPTTDIQNQSSVYSIRESVNYVWDGANWTFSTPHTITPTHQSGSGTTCGTSPVFSSGASDREGIIVPNGGGTITSCTVTFGTDFSNQPAIQFTQYNNPGAGSIVTYTGTGSPAFVHGFTITGTHLEGAAFAWSVSATQN